MLLAAAALELSAEERGIVSVQAAEAITEGGGRDGVRDGGGGRDGGVVDGGDNP